MKRREFIAIAGGAAATWPVTAFTQQAGRLPIVGFLGASASGFAPWAAAFMARMRELGWVEGRTIAIEYRWSEGRPERYAEIAAEFVRLNVDVILTVGSAVPIVRQATTVIPIVFAVAIDPVGSGLVTSLAKPGGNATGLSIQANELAGKRLEFLREAIPQLHRLAILFNADNTQPVLEMGEAQAEARRLRLDIAPLAIRRADDIGPAFQDLKARADAVYVAVDQLIVANRAPILTLHLASGCRQFSVNVTSLKRERSCATGQVTRNCSGTRQTMSIRSCVGPSPAISLSSSRPSLSLSSTSKPPRPSDSHFQNLSWCALTR